jgi:hypothetical protein
VTLFRSREDSIQLLYAVIDRSKPILHGLKGRNRILEVGYRLFDMVLSNE